MFSIHYHLPFDWQGLLHFFSSHCLKGAEKIEAHAYFRSVQIEDHKGWLRVSHDENNQAVIVEMSASLLPVSSLILEKISCLFDLKAYPDQIKSHLMHDPLLAEEILKYPGLRVPRSFNGFELAVRAILGQQVTVKAATTLAGRLVQAFGEKIETPFSSINYLCPLPSQIASLEIEDLTALGIIRSRARSIIELAKEVSAHRLQLDSTVDPLETIRQLVKLPGIGPWTAQYIAMRALGWSDAFLKEDLAILKRLGGIKAKKAEELSQAWKPWRSYATLYLWQQAIHGLQK